MSDEQDIANLIKKFQNQTAALSKIPSYLGNNPIIEQGRGNVVDSHTGIDNQGTGYETPTPINPGQITRSGPSPIPVQNGCPQCGLIHPPLPPGEKCPNAGAKMKGAAGKEKLVDINKYLVNLRNILMSQIDSKGIEDVDKLFKNITLEITKYLEGYKE